MPTTKIVNTNEWINRQAQKGTTYSVKDSKFFLRLQFQQSSYVHKLFKFWLGDPTSSKIFFISLQKDFFFTILPVFVHAESGHIEFIIHF